MTADGTQNSPQAAQALDEEALSRLLALAGPSDARELMRRLIVDVQAAAEGIRAGLEADDSAALRQHSHVLLAVAGTIGAQAIYDLSRQVNSAVKDGNLAAARPLAEALSGQLHGLVERLRDLSAELGFGG